MKGNFCTWNIFAPKLFLLTLEMLIIDLRVQGVDISTVLYSGKTDIYIYIPVQKEVLL